MVDRVASSLGPEETARDCVMRYLHSSRTGSACLGQVSLSDKGIDFRSAAVPLQTSARSVDEVSRSFIMYDSPSPLFGLLERGSTSEMADGMISAT